MHRAEGLHAFAFFHKAVYRELQWEFSPTAREMEDEDGKPVSQVSALKPMLWTSLLSLPTVPGPDEAWESTLSKQDIGKERGSRSPESTLPQQARSRPHILDYDVLPHHGGSGISEQPQHLATYPCHGRQREAPLCWRCNPTLGFELLHGTMCSGLFLSQERRPWNEGWAQCPTRRSQMGPIQAIVPG